MKDDEKRVDKLLKDAMEVVDRDLRGTACHCFDKLLADNTRFMTDEISPNVTYQEVLGVLSVVIDRLDFANDMICGVTDSGIIEKEIR